MDLLKQCQQWFEQDEAQKVIDTLEAIPAEERTPELDSELAKAYIAVAHIGEREPFEKALELLAPHEEYFAEDHCWNYRIASAYYYLDEEGPALRYFEKALEARPGDNDTQEYIDDCRRRLSLPRFEKNFRERTQEAWAAFSQIEAELRQIIDTDETHQRGEELVEKCGNALKTALRDTSFELGFNGEKHELILSPEGLRSRLFPLVYFQKQAPESVLEHWNIWVGRQPCEGFELRAGEIEVRAEDVQMWAEETEDHQVSLVLYCEKLTPILKEDTDKVWWALSMLVDQTIGEVSAIAFVAGFDVYAQPKDEPAKLLSELPELLQSMGLFLWRDGSDYLENSYLAYELKLVEDPEADWRLDVYTGSCRLPVLINDYLTARSDMVDEYHKDGIAAGFLLYPLSGFTGEERVKAILDFRDNLRDAILRDAGEEAVTFLGGATGLYCGYLDFIAWDLPAVLTAAQAFFEGSDLPYAHFHAFRRDVGGVPLLDEKEPEPDIHEETGSLLSTEDIEILESFDEGTAAYFGKMLDWLENFIKSGVEEGRFSEKQAHQDLQIALWYAFACLNLDDYIHYYRAAEWMKDSEKNATGCATWYYRYSVALMYCGRLEEALEYAERGAKEEPDYPWIWLHLGKLRAHFGDKSGALDAVKQGLKLEPGDYEFLTLKKEIRAGATLEQMEYHWIDPEADQTLQEGLDADADDKQRSISCITVNKDGLERFWSIFAPDPEKYVANAPYTQFPYTVNGHMVDLVFQMNEAGLSKLDAVWLEQLKGWLQSGQWLERLHPDGRAACLDTVLVGLDYRMGLLYKLTEDDAYFQIFLNPDGTEQEGTFWSSEENRVPEVYTEEEMSAIEQHIKNTFGEFENVFHELVSPDIHVDICVVPPSDERDYYTLVTMGMGAHRMNVPEELAEYKLERAELAIALPADWKLDQESMKDEKWYWPIRLLKSLARLPINCDSWLGHGHTVENREPFADNTKLCTATLIGPQDTEDGSEVCTLPGGEEVNFYQVIPLYEDELDYKLEHDTDALLNKMRGISFVVNPTRQDAITRGTLSNDDFDGEMDDASYHIESIEEKELPIDPINAYNHMAIYLRWCMEHDLMGEEFLAEYGEVVEKVKADSASVDLREFIRDELDGCLFSVLFNQQGRAFAGYYYGEGDSPYYPADVDDNALRFFGPERYHSDEFQDEAYLFIPFDEDYYQAMAEMIEERFENWQGQDFNEDTLEPSEVAHAIMEYLDCECTYFPSMADDDPIMSAYSYAKRESVKESFVPVLIKADDETLLECLVMNADPENDADIYEFDLKTVTEYRKKMLSAPIKDGKAVLEELTGQRKEEAEDDDMDWDEEVLGEMEGGYDNRRFSSYWNSDNDMTYPLILAKIPVKNPWELFAWLPFGNWNECPDTPELMAVAKYWFEQHGAVPAAMSHDELEFLLPAPVSQEKAMEVAAEQYGFCPDIVDQEQDDPTVGNLADVLRQSTVWYFWWD